MLHEMWSKSSVNLEMKMNNHIWLTLADNPEGEIPKVQFAWNKCSSRFCILNINSGFRLSLSEVWCVPRSALETQGFCGHTKSVRSTFARLALLWLPPDLLIETQLERLVLRCSGGHPVYTAEINMHKDIIPKTFWSPLKKLQKVVNRQWPL